MLGAIIGDIAGSKYEFHNIKTKDFTLLEDDCYFTDDTVMTCAVAESLLSSRGDNIIKKLKKYGQNFPNCGFGGNFFFWVLSDYDKPYNSCGNGSAMRVSPVGWVAKDENEVKILSRKITAITHNHPEGIKGAEVVAMCVFKALHGASKEQLREYIISQYPEVARLDYEELRKTYFHGKEICQLTVPQALYCFLISKDFEDCLKTTISIGGDCDTTSAISGAVAEAYYGIPNEIKNKVFNYFTTKKEKALLKPVLELYNKLDIKRKE